MTEGRNRRGYLGVWSPRGIAAIASYLAPKLMILVIFETGKNVEIMVFSRARAGGRSPPAFGSPMRVRAAAWPSRVSARKCF